jgi:hypothetical protein
MDDLDNIIDDDLVQKPGEDDIKALAKKLRRKYFITFLVIATLNTILFYTFEKTLHFVFGGENALGALFIGVLGWGFILGFLFNLIPYKNIPYWKRYLGTSFLIASAIGGLMLVLLILNIIMRTHL